MVGRAIAASASARTTSPRTAARTTASTRTIYDLQNIMLGKLDEVVQALRAHDREQRLKSLA
jgi:protein subunit release factor A